MLFVLSYGYLQLISRLQLFDVLINEVLVLQREVYLVDSHNKYTEEYEHDQKQELVGHMLSREYPLLLREDLVVAPAILAEDLLCPQYLGSRTVGMRFVLKALTRLNELGVYPKKLQVYSFV